MTTTWVATIIANLLLLCALVPARRKFPMFFGCQMIVMATGLMLAWGFYSPRVDAGSYREAWMTCDQMYILMAAVIAWEVWEKSSSRFLCIMAVLLALHSGMMLWDYAHDVFEQEGFMRVMLNIPLTFGLALAVYSDRKGESMKTKKVPKTPIKPADIVGSGAPSKKPPPSPAG